MHILYSLNWTSVIIFDEYELDEDFQISIDCDGFEKILKRCLSDDVIYIEVTQDDFNLKYEGEAVRRFKVPSLSDDDFDKEFFYIWL